jgi:hypothetical protein
VLRQELDHCLEQAGHQFEPADIIRDLKVLENVIVEVSECSLQFCTTAVGCCGKVFEAVGVGMPPSIRYL